VRNFDKNFRFFVIVADPSVFLFEDVIGEHSSKIILPDLLPNLLVDERNLAFEAQFLLIIKLSIWNERIIFQKLSTIETRPLEDLFLSLFDDRNKFWELNFVFL
jgi:hypothetical protein